MISAILSEHSLHFQHGPWRLTGQPRPPPPPPPPPPPSTPSWPPGLTTQSEAVRPLCWSTVHTFAAWTLVAHRPADLLLGLRQRPSVGATDGSSTTVKGSARARRKAVKGRWKDGDRALTGRRKGGERAVKGRWKRGTRLTGRSITPCPPPLKRWHAGRLDRVDHLFRLTGRSITPCPPPQSTPAPSRPRSCPLRPRSCAAAALPPH